MLNSCTIVGILWDFTCTLKSWFDYPPNLMWMLQIECLWVEIVAQWSNWLFVPLHCCDIIGVHWGFACVHMFFLENFSRAFEVMLVCVPSCAVKVYGFNLCLNCTRGWFWSLLSVHLWTPLAKLCASMFSLASICNFASVWSYAFVCALVCFCDHSLCLLSVFVISVAFGLPTFRLCAITLQWLLKSAWRPPPHLLAGPQRPKVTPHSLMSSTSTI